MTHRIPIVVIACGLLAGVVCCHRDEPPTHAKGGVAQLSSSVKTPEEIEALWNQRLSAIQSTDAKARFELDSKAFQKVLAEDCSQADRDALLDFAANAPGGNNKDGFARVAVAGLIAFYAAAGDRDSLVQVLAKAAPQKVGLRDVEDYVVLSSPKIPDSVTVLFDAYALSTSPDAKSAIAGGLRHGFAFAGSLPADDTELVAWVKKWYDEHRTTHVPNRDYSSNKLRGERSGANPLFKAK